MPEIVRTVLPPAEIMELLFNRCRAGGHIALGSRRPTWGDKSGETSPHWFGTMPTKPVSEQQRLFSRFIGVLLDQTKYTCANTFKRSALRVGKAENAPLRPIEKYAEALASPVPKPLYFQFYDNHVREVVALFADLDSYRHGISAEDALAVVYNRALYGHIPFPSMLAKSGRGAYVLWLLREHDSTLPPLVTPPIAHLFRMITMALHGKLHDLGVDKNARRLAQWFKAPGTIDTKTGLEVVYSPQYPNGEIPLHSLEGLSEFLDVHTGDFEIPDDQPRQITVQPGDQPAPRPYLQPVKVFKWRDYKRSTKAVPREKHNAAARLILRYQELEALMAHRHGIVEHAGRWMICLHYYSAIWGAYHVGGDLAHAREQARRHVRLFNRAWCKPPLPEKWLIDKLERQTKKPWYSAAVICAALGITREEVEKIPLRHLLPADIREERNREKKQRQQQTISTRATKREAVTEAIKAGRSNAQIKRDLRQHFTDRGNTSDVYLHRLRTALGVDDPGSTKAHRRHLPLIKG